jgi:hypothetical protein
MRHLRRAKNMSAGTDAALLSRLTVETFASEAAARNARGLLSNLSARTGEAILQQQNYWPQSRAFTSYAKIAHAAGRPDLALSLMAASLAAGNPVLRSPNVTPYDLAMRRAQTLELAALAAAGRHGSLNLNHTWSLRIEAERQEIEIHPNSSQEGDATLIFAGLSFAVPTLFSTELELTSFAKGPVIFDLEFQAPTVDSQTFEWLLHPGERKSVELPVPATFLPGCDVLLATRMMRRQESTEGAHAKWHGPAFRPR